jgi:hypothetical protein
MNWKMLFPACLTAIAFQPTVRAHLKLSLLLFMRFALWISALLEHVLPHVNIAKVLHLSYPCLHHFERYIRKFPQFFQTLSGFLLIPKMNKTLTLQKVIEEIF